MSYLHNQDPIHQQTMAMSQSLIPVDSPVDQQQHLHHQGVSQQQSQQLYTSTPPTFAATTPSSPAALPAAAAAAPNPYGTSIIASHQVKICFV